MTQKILPCLWFDDNAEEAVNLYASIFKESSIEGIVRYGKGEEPDKEGTVKYAGFKLLGHDFGAMDSAHNHNFTFNEAVSLIINCSGQGEIDYFYSKLSADPKSEMCGWIKDKFGVSWQLVTADMNKLITGKNAEKAMSELLNMGRINVKKLREASR